MTIVSILGRRDGWHRVVALADLRGVREDKLQRFPAQLPTLHLGEPIDQALQGHDTSALLGQVESLVDQVDGIGRAGCGSGLRRGRSNRLLAWLATGLLAAVCR